MYENFSCCYIVSYCILKTIIYELLCIFKITGYKDF